MMAQVRIDFQAVAKHALLFAENQEGYTTVLETHGSEADWILRRYGPYCTGCHHSNTESIELAARQHGVEVRRVDLLVKELNRAFFDAETPSRDHE